MVPRFQFLLPSIERTAQPPPIGTHHGTNEQAEDGGNFESERGLNRNEADIDIRGMSKSWKASGKGGIYLWMCWDICITH
jgi:hypothetical protein